MTLKLATMGSTSQAATHSPDSHFAFHGYNNNASEGILTPCPLPVANNDTACAPRERTTAEVLAACELLQPVIPEGRKPIEVATVLEGDQVDMEGQCKRLQTPNRGAISADPAEWITKQEEVSDDSGHGESIETTPNHSDDQVMFRRRRTRQSRTFICDREDCIKYRDGFTSNNDLVRHKRTVHGDNLKGPTYICNNGDCAKGDPRKWLRTDNFRRHLKTAHKIEQVGDIDLQHYSTSSESVADEEQCDALSDDTKNKKGGVEITENEKAGVEINEDKFGEYFNSLPRAKKLKFLALVPAKTLQAALLQQGEGPETGLY